MALRSNVTIEASVQKKSEFGILETRVESVTLTDCYIKVDTVKGTKESADALVLFTTPEVEGSRLYSFTPDMDGDNFIKQAYLHLKTLPEFASATDC
jgi:hypothetical protein